MEIRKTHTSDIVKVMKIYDYAKQYMAENGNGNQWTKGYPEKRLIENDIQNGNSYVCIDGDEIVGTFFFAQGTEPTYTEIFNGKWLDNEAYAVIHRIAVATNKKGIATYCIKWCYEKCPNIRIDTHRDNIPMQRALKKLGYTYCGIIHLHDGDERMAFQKNSND